MMTTGYDCEDLLNICLMRPIFSPQDFVQIKGRGTRKFAFEYKRRTAAGDTELVQRQKERFKLFDFFANCEYFEHRYKYDEVIELPSAGAADAGGEGPPPVRVREYDYAGPDPLKSLVESAVGLDGMRIDREFFGRFEQVVKKDDFVAEKVASGDFDAAETYIIENIFEKPEDFFNLEKLRKAAQLDRRLTLREILEKIFGFIPGFKSKDQLLDEECQKFISIYKPGSDYVLPVRNFLRAYITDARVREIIESRRFADFATSPIGDDFRALTPDLRKLIPEYVKDYVPLNKFI
jgi:type I restriction enzyme R subunit